MKCTTGLSAHQFAELTQWISQSKPLHTIPAILGVAGSLQATLIYLRHNLPQAAIGELLGVSQPTVSRAVKALTELVTRALDGYLITAEEVAPGCDYVLDGTLMPCWSWKAHPELWSGKHKRTGLNIQVLVTPAGRLVWVSDPCPGSTHDVAALDASGLLEGLDVSGWVADKGYIGRGMITPPRKPAGKQLSDTAKKVSRSINRVRYIVEQVNAHIKTWKILKEDYRRPLDTFPQTITATLMLYTYTTQGVGK
ncbi:transposase, partial [Actinomyces oris]|uniref:transposase family protein n=1 Tax=Actinomyces oris TaxID=544580 RepID=UPI00094D3315